jgi:hypothetical protein
MLAAKRHAQRLYPRKLRIVFQKGLGFNPPTKNSKMMCEQVEAARHGMTLRVYRLQQQLRRLPVNPHNETMRKARDQVSKELIRLARRDRCVPKINLMAGIVDR